MREYYAVYEGTLYLVHHGILGQKWGVRRFQNPDGTRTAAGKKREKHANRNKQAELQQRAIDYMDKNGFAWRGDPKAARIYISAEKYSKNPHSPKECAAKANALAALATYELMLDGDRLSESQIQKLERKNFLYTGLAQDIDFHFVKKGDAGSTREEYYKLFNKRVKEKLQELASDGNPRFKRLLASCPAPNENDPIWSSEKPRKDLSSWEKEDRDELIDLQAMDYESLK